MDGVEIMGADFKIEGSVVGSETVISRSDMRPRGLHLVVGERTRILF